MPWCALPTFFSSVAQLEFFWKIWASGHRDRVAGHAWRDIIVVYTAKFWWGLIPFNFLAQHVATTNFFGNEENVLKQYPLPSAMRGRGMTSSDIISWKSLCSPNENPTQKLSPCSSPWLELVTLCVVRRTCTAFLTWGKAGGMWVANVSTLGNQLKELEVCRFFFFFSS